MYGQQRNSGIYNIVDYEQALKKWQDTKPIRGRAVEVRPLGHRHNVNSYRIAKTEDGSVQCILYKTPVVTFRPNGEVMIQNDSYNSVSTTYFIEEVMGIYARIFDNSLCIGMDYTGMNTRIPREGCFLKRNKTTGKYEVLNEQPFYVHVINRKKANNVRANYKEFFTYMQGICKLKGNSTYPDEEYERVLGVQEAHAKWPSELDRTEYAKWDDDIVKFFKLITDTNAETRNDSFYNAMLQVARTFGHRMYKTGEQGYVLTEKRAVDGLYSLILGWHRDECLEAKQLPQGAVRRDSNGKYYSYGWRRLHEKRVA